jgi:hypothetical protein
LNHSVLLSNQLKIGWEYFAKGFISKDWRYIQNSYYKYLKLNTRKYNAEKWVQQLLRTLHKFRTDLWQLRNAALHGGYSHSHGSALRARLLSEVHSLYKKDRSCLSLADRQLFHLPKTYRLRQGNQQLMLWTKRAHMTFDIYDEKLNGPQQAYITDWLNSWQSPTSYPLSSILTTDPTTTDASSVHSDSRILPVPTMGHTETTTIQFNNMINKDTNYGDSDNDSSISCDQEYDGQIKTMVIKRTNRVADGTSQQLTPLRSSPPDCSSNLIKPRGDERDCGICYLRNRS